MTITSETYIDKAEILADGQIQVREAKVIYEDGKEISRSYHRMVLDPGRDTLTDVQAKCADKESKVNVCAVAEALWTEEKVAERQATLETQTRETR